MADSYADEAVTFCRHVQDVESNNRAEALEDLKFRFGDQWPAAMIDARGNRPKLTVNETDAYIRQIVNALREQRPRIKCYAANTAAQKKLADIISGVIRHIQVMSDADYAYDLAGEFAVTMGWGYWRLVADYVREDSFQQDIFIKAVENPFSVYFDPNSNQPDGSDAEQCLITDKMSLKEFRRLYPGRQDTAGFTLTASGDTLNDWITKTDIRLAEYFKVEKSREKLIGLSNGEALWADELTPDFQAAMTQAGLRVIGDRESWKRKVVWRKITAFEVLEEKSFPSRWIPVVPCSGSVMVIDSKKVRLGAVRFARDPARMVNYWQTAITEMMAMGPKPKWLMAEGQDEGHENEWNKANIDAMPLLRYKPTDIEGKPAPPPQRIAPEPPPEGLIVSTQMASSNLQKVFGMFDPARNQSAQNKSDKTINAETQQTERSNFHFYDNQTRSLKHTGRIILDMMQHHIYDTQRVAAILGEDGKPDMVTLNEKKLIGEVENDVTVGEYGVIMDVGPGYNSKRQEAADILGQILSKDPQLMQQIGDLFFRNLDFPGSEIIADRLAANNPLAQIDDKSDVPPQAQMMIKALQDKLQKAMQALQQAGIEIKFGLQKEQMKQDGENKRALMSESAYAHDVEQQTATHRHDVEMRALSSLGAAELDGLVKLLLKHLDTSQFREQAAHERDMAETKANSGEAPLQ